MKMSKTKNKQIWTNLSHWNTANVQLVNRDIVTAVIYCYTTTQFHSAKGDSRLSTYYENVCQRNVARFSHVKGMFDKINDIFQGFGSLVSLRLQKDVRTKSKQIWTNLSHWSTANVQLVNRDIVTAVIYYYTTTEFHFAKDDFRLSAY